MKRTGFKIKPRKPMKRTKLKFKSESKTATIKQGIQDTLRLLVTHRDGGCILRDKRCGVTAFVDEDNKIVASSSYIQADHLVTRANSATFADVRLVVCVCNGCHLWKKYHKKEYNDLVKTIISKERVTLWERAEEYRSQHRTEKMDWNMQLCGLQLMLKEYEQ